MDKAERKRLAAAKTGMSSAAAMADPVAYLQRRVALFAKSLFFFFLGVNVLDAGLTGIFWIEGAIFFSPTRFATVAIVLIFGLIWWFARRPGHSEGMLRVLETLATVFICGIFSVFPLDDQGMGEISHLMIPFSNFAIAATLMVRAAVVPSTALRTFVIGVVCSVPLAVVAGYSYDVASPVAHIDRSTIGWTFSLVQGLLYAVVAAIISKIIFGLEAKVRAAMQLGQYTLEEKIGEGGMGAVYRARHALLRRPTAIKLLPPDKAGERAIARFEREVQQTSRLTHPNTVAIYDFGHTPDGVFYYAMEYIDGLSLDELVQLTGPLPPARVIHLLVQAAEALAEAHDIGLIHRDIKPANIALCQRGGVADVVKVVDFGLVKDIAAPADVRLSTTATITGTPLYLAPESLTDPDTVDGRTDLYALGAVGYYLLTGEPVFDGKTMVEVCGHHLHSVPESPSERLGSPIDDELEAIVLACLQKKAADRPADGHALRDELLACEAAGAWSRQDATSWWERNTDAINEFQVSRRSELSSQLSKHALTVAIGARTQ